jgi:hypothetical protein
MTFPTENSVVFYGDEEKFAMDLLRADSFLLSLYPDCTISGDLIGYQKGRNWVQVVAKGGNILDATKISKPRIDFYILGANRESARKIGQLVMRAFLLKAGFYTVDQMTLSDVKVETGLVRVPDKATDADRYVLSLRLTVIHNNMSPTA